MLVFKDGEVVVEDGKVTRAVRGTTQVVRPEYDPAIERRIGQWFDRYHATRMANFRISDDEMAEGIGSPIGVHPCRGRTRA
jgi:formylmethanofuran dehydrogenase subunit A